MKALKIAAIICVMACVSTAAHAAGAKTKCPAGMVFVPEGDFIMGCADYDHSCYDNERGGRSVHLKGYCVDKTEVTNQKYEQCVKAGKCDSARQGACGIFRQDSPFSYYRDETEWMAIDVSLLDAVFSKPDHPVVCVDWQDASQYCKWAGKRLPTEAEWEKAARGENALLYPWGFYIDKSKANYSSMEISMFLRDDDGYPYTAPVGSYPAGASPYGALDMAGNVWEWTQDCYDAEWYYYMPYMNPVNEAPYCEERTLRGGTWMNLPKNLRASDRGRHEPSYRSNNGGFRCGADPK